MKTMSDMKGGFRMNGNEQGSAGGTPDESAPVNMEKKIVFNGIEYDDIDEMPTYARNLYEQALKRQTTDAAITRDRSETAGRPLRSEPSFSAGSVIMAITLVCLGLLALYFFQNN